MNINKQKVLGSIYFLSFCCWLLVALPYYHTLQFHFVVVHCYFTFVGLVLFLPNFFRASLGMMNLKLSFPNLVSFSPFVSKEFFLCEVFPFREYFLFAFIASLCLFLCYLLMHWYMLWVVQGFLATRKKFHVSHSLNIMFIPQCMEMNNFVNDCKCFKLYLFCSK